MESSATKTMAVHMAAALSGAAGDPERDDSVTAVAALWSTFGIVRDPATRDALIAHYTPFARHLAARLFRLRADDSVPFADYFQYARVGLVEAVDRYDPAREASFETFSTYRIRGAVLNGLGKESELAAQRAYWRTQVQERIDSLKSEAFANGQPTLDDFVDLTVGLAIGVLLDPEPDEELPDISIPANPYAGTELAGIRRIVCEAVEQLPDRERMLVVRHYFKQEEFQTIAAELGITKGRVSQLHSAALGRIRKRLSAGYSKFDLNL
jgi:RNA polymerase sigma factor for flagellar operon FliA